MTARRRGHVREGSGIVLPTNALASALTKDRIEVAGDATAKLGDRLSD